MNLSLLEKNMELAILEGRKALPDCLPNPPVGALLVRKQKVLAKGYTQPPGKEHAEIMVLNSAGEDLIDTQLYVTLEPCAFHGRTPSCALRIAESGIKEVYVGILDPDPRNNGKGIQILKDAGIKVTLGVLREQILLDLLPYLLR